MRILTKEDKIKIAKMYAESSSSRDIPLEINYIEVTNMWIINAGDTVLVDYLEEQEAKEILKNITA